MLLGPRGLFLVSSRFGNTKTGVGDMDISLDEVVSAWHQHGTHVYGSRQHTGAPGRPLIRGWGVGTTKAFACCLINWRWYILLTIEDLPA